MYPMEREGPMRTKVTTLTPPVCPRCQRTTHPGQTCGQVAGDITPAESLFEAYITARLVRARRILTAAKVAFLRHPLDEEKRRVIERIEADIRRLKAQLLDPIPVAGSIAVPAMAEHPTPAFRARQAAQADAMHSATETRAEPFLRDSGAAADVLTDSRE